MPYRPRLRRHLDAHVEPPDLVIVHGDGIAHRFHNRLLPLLVPHLDGRNTPEDLVEILTREVADCSLLDVVYGLQLLAEKDCLTDLDDDDLAGAHDALELDARARQRLEATPIRIQTLGDFDTTPLSEALTSSGLRVDDTADVGIVVTDDYLSPDLEALNRCTLDAGTPWMLLRPTGTTPWIGPIFRPGSTGCWACLARRLRLNLPYVDLLGAPPSSTLPAVRNLAWQAAALRVLRWVTSETPGDLEGRLWTLDGRTLETREHVLVRLPDCPACGEPRPQADTTAHPVQLSDAPLCDAHDGGFRAVPAEVTFERLHHHVSPLTGLVHDLRPATTGTTSTTTTTSGADEHGLHVYLAEHPSLRRDASRRYEPGSGPRRRARG